MFGHAMAKARQAAKLSQREAAAGLGIGQAYVAGLEIGRNNPETLNLIVNMAKLYCCTLEQLLGVELGAVDLEDANGILSRLSPGRRKDIIEIAKTFLLMESQEYRTQVIGDLVISSEMFDGGRVTELLLREMGVEGEQKG